MDKEIEKELPRFLNPELIKLIKVLKEKEFTSEYVIADKLKKDINFTRGLLYQLAQENLVEITKKKDKIKGWYIYYWKFLDKRVPIFIKKKLKEQKEKYDERIEREENNNFFTCPNKCVRLTFDEATNYEFRCPECGELLKEEDNKELVEKLKKRREEIENEIREIDRKIEGELRKKEGKLKEKTEKKKKKRKKKRESKIKRKKEKKKTKAKADNKKDKKKIRKTKEKENKKARKIKRKTEKTKTAKTGKNQPRRIR